MARIYSTVFVDSHGTGTGVVLEYDFSGADVFVVRDVASFCGQATGLAQFQIYDAAGATWMYDEVETASIGCYTHWTGRQVFYPGDKLFLTGQAASIVPALFDWRVSGYTLSP